MHLFHRWGHWERSKKNYYRSSDPDTPYRVVEIQQRRCSSCGLCQAKRMRVKGEAKWRP